jgi:DNA-binding PadR family transcriptional regulator
VTRNRTSTTANAVLGLLALRASWTTAELTAQLSRNMRFFWPRAESRVFAEAKTLVGRGWATATTEGRSGPGAPTQTRYRITAAGRRELLRWLSTSPRRTQLESEPLLRILLGDLGTTDQLRAAIEQIATDAADLLAVADSVAEEYLTGSAPFQDHVHVRALVYDYLVGHAQHQAGWASRAMAYVDQLDHADTTAKQEAGVAHIRGLRPRGAARTG